MPKLTQFIIMLVVFMVVFVGGIVTLMSELNENYGSNAIGFNETYLNTYNKLDEISEDTEQVKNSSTELSSESGVLDVLGGFFESAYGTLKIAANSFDVFSDISNKALDDTGIHNSDLLKTAIISIVLILLFLGVIISAVVKWVM